MGRLFRPSSWTERDEDDVLVERCLAGQGEAFGVLYDRHLPGLYAYAYRLTGNQADAQDAAHDTLTKAWSKLRAYQPGNFRAWLFSIAHNTCIDRMRSARAGDVPLLESEWMAADDSTERQAIDLATISDIATLLSHFPESQRSVVAMKLAGLKYSEIAAALGKSEAAVAQDYSRAIRKLADALERGPVPAATGKGGGHDV
jgi:RNA polymerase sigma-70 factor (ECF subfamily)